MQINHTTGLHVGTGGNSLNSSVIFLAVPRRPFLSLAFHPSPLNAIDARPGARPAMSTKSMT